MVVCNRQYYPTCITYIYVSVIWLCGRYIWAGIGGQYMFSNSIWGDGWPGVMHRLVSIMGGIIHNSIDMCNAICYTVVGKLFNSTAYST